MEDCVFICYARADEGFVLPLVTHLRNQGVPVWMDQLSLQEGADWDQAIDQALVGCSHFLIVLSPSAVASREVRGELRLALDEDKPIVPVLYKDCHIPRQLRVIQYADFRSRNPDDEEAIQDLLDTLGQAMPPLSHVEPRQQPWMGQQSDSRLTDRDAAEGEVHFPGARTSRRRTFAIWVLPLAAVLLVSSGVLAYLLIPRTPAVTPTPEATGTPEVVAEQTASAETVAAQTREAAEEAATAEAQATLTAEALTAEALTAEALTAEALTAEVLTVEALTADARPDLIITSAKASLKGYSGGCINQPLPPLVTEVCIKNEGKSTAGPFTVEAGTARWTAQRLGAGQTACLEQEGASPGQATVDADNEVDELDEGNNAASIPVPTPPPTCPPPVVEQPDPEVVHVLNQITVQPRASNFAHAACPSDSVVTGGGFVINPALDIETSAPLGTGWLVQASNKDSSPHNLQTYAICVLNASGPSSYVEAETSVPGHDNAHITATCPTGSVVTGGGFVAGSSLRVYAQVKTQDGWQVYANNPTSSSSPRLVAYAVCLASPEASVQQVEARVGVSARGTGHAVADCPGDSVVTGGGYQGGLYLNVYNSTRSDTGWQVYAQSSASTVQAITAYAICLSVP